MKSSPCGIGIARERSVRKIRLAFEQPDEQRLATLVVARDLGAELADARRQLVGGEVDLADARIAREHYEARSRRKC